MFTQNCMKIQKEDGGKEIRAGASYSMPDKHAR